MTRLALAVGFMAVFGFVTVFIINKIAETYDRKYKKKKEKEEKEESEEKQKDSSK